MTETNAPANYPAAFEAWRKNRLDKLKAADGWLNIIARFWLETGTVSVGSAQDNDLVLSAGPAHLGALTQAEDKTVTFLPADGSKPIHVTPDEEHPPQFMVGPLLLEITSLNGDNALRIRDTESNEPAQLKPIASFPLKPEWRIVADWVRLDAPQGKTINTTKDIETDVEVTHKAVFSHDGRTYARRQGKDPSHLRLCGGELQRNNLAGKSSLHRRHVSQCLLQIFQKDHPQNFY